MIWLLLQEGRISLRTPIAEVVPEFASNGKHTVTLQHVLLHEGGFPRAPYPIGEWDDREARHERFARWQLEWEPGTRYEYHGISGHWVLADMIERVEGIDFREVVRRRILDPLLLSDLRIGLPGELNTRVKDIVLVGEPAPVPDLLAFGERVPSAEEVRIGEAFISALNKAKVRAVGVPGGGGISDACSLALFYQALLADVRGERRIWDADLLAEMTRPRDHGFRHPNGVRVNRGLGVMTALGDSWRGLGSSRTPNAFGHDGAGGQLGWADPNSGVSFAYLTNGFDRHTLRQWRRCAEVSAAVFA